MIDVKNDTEMIELTAEEAREFGAFVETAITLEDVLVDGENDGPDR